MTNTDHITVEVAKALKEAGYSEPCNTSFVLEGVEYAAPGWVALANYIYRTTNKRVNISLNSDLSSDLQTEDENSLLRHRHFIDYESAFLAALDELKGGSRG